MSFACIVFGAVALSARAVALSARAEADAAHKETFFSNMRSMASATSSDTTTRSDECRRGAPLPSTENKSDLLSEFFPEAVDEGAAWSAWAAFRDRHAKTWRAPPSTTSQLRENRHVHPSIHFLLEAAAASGGLRVWHDAAAPDDVERAHIRPDFTLTSTRDSGPSTIGGLLLVEVKLPGNLDAAQYQTRVYLRRRVFKLCCEADERGEPLDGIAAFGAATDGVSVVVVRIASGAPRPGESFKGAKPCPATETAPLALFGAQWNFRRPPPFRDGARGGPPAGFRALLRVCASPRVLGDGGLLTKLSCRLHFAGDGAAAGVFALGGARPGRKISLCLASRLGSGGTSDVYKVSGAAGDDCVLKVARVATKRVVNEFLAEQGALIALRDAAAERLVPECVASGERAASLGALAALAGARSFPWPVLLLRPAGVPVAEWVTSRVESAAAAAAAAAGNEHSCSWAAAASAARVQCADEVVLRVLRALEAARAQRLVHCDVRPSNIVVAAADAACLVDWGIARKEGVLLKSCGVAAYADRRIFSDHGVAARPCFDVLAALFTWLAIACGEGCAAPWAGEAASAEGDEIFAARTQWIRARAYAAAGRGSARRGGARRGGARRGGAEPTADQRAASVASGILKLEAADGSSDNSDPFEVARDCFINY